MLVNIVQATKKTDKKLYSAAAAATVNIYAGEGTFSYLNFPPPFFLPGRPSDTNKQNFGFFYTFRNPFEVTTFT